MANLPDTVSKIADTLQRHNATGDGMLGVSEFRLLMSNLDPQGQWTDESIKTVLQSTGIDAAGRIPPQGFIRALFASSLDYAAVREDLKAAMISPEWDDGSYAPLLIRLAWHSSGTYSAVDGTGGCNGAGMRHALEAGDPENAGLAQARAYLDPIAAKYPWLSTADLWILAGYVALEVTGGPVIPFTGGRIDCGAERAIAPGRLPGAETGCPAGLKCDEEGRINGWEGTAQHIRDVFGRMGLSDQEAVALQCGGHVYGRCHDTSSGYKGAWVENPTMFSNEYAADLVGDKWIAVEHDTKLPDGGPVPEEVRPAPGKRQYIDLSKYMPEEEESEVRAAPNATEHPPGRYKCRSQWVNCREAPATDSAIIGRFEQEQELCLVEVKIFGTAVRGLAERGGWVSIVGSGGKTLFERLGDLDAKALEGRYRVTVANGAPFFAAVGSSEGAGRVQAGEEFSVSEIVFGQDGDRKGAILGKRGDPGSGEGSYVLLYSPGQGVVAELVVQGYNEKPRKPIAGQTGHQMMLITDMVLLWDAEFRKTIEVYAEDEEKLKEDFGAAFLKLTELGCPWSKTYQGPVSAEASLRAATPGKCPMAH